MGIIEMLKIWFSRLYQVWVYSDSQPTEILLALCSIFLVPTAIITEVGSFYFYVGISILSGIYQIMCVARHDLKCRVRASVITFSVYCATVIMYLTHVGFPSTTHYGWLVFVLAAYGSMSRVTKENVYRNGGI